MIRAGLGKPRLTFIPGHNDMSHFTPGHWSTNWHFIMSVDQYVEKHMFSHFNMNPTLSRKDIHILMAKIYNQEEISYFESPWAYSMQQQIKKAGGSALWQFNAISPYLDGYVRGCVGLGEKTLVRWTLFDVYVVAPILELTANILNILRKPIANKEMRNWNAYLEKVSRK